MKIKALSLAAALAVTAGISDASACTNLIAGKGATADSSVMVTYAADSHSLYGELYYQPAAKHPAGAMRKVVEWDTGKYLGEIPEVAETYNVGRAGAPRVLLPQRAGPRRGAWLRLGGLSADFIRSLRLPEGPGAAGGGG